MTPGALVRHVFRLNRAEFRWIVLSMILLAIVSVAAPIFNEQVFSVVIPNADKALMVQIFLMSAVFVAGTVALQYMNAVIGARIRRNCEWHLQTALMDRLLDLPSAFFRDHSRGELKNRFDSILLLVQVFSNGAVSALLNVVTLVPATVMMCVYSPRRWRTTSGRCRCRCRRSSRRAGSSRRSPSGRCNAARLGELGIWLNSGGAKCILHNRRMRQVKCDGEPPWGLSC